MRYDILEWIWDGINGRPYMAVIDRADNNKFSETHILEGMELLEQKAPGQDLFFTPLGYDGARRNSHARNFSLLFADLDHMNVDLVNKIPPHLWWQTGPRTTQGIWKLNARIGEYDKWASLNQRMTYFMEADRGGWAGSKFLRVPETINYKYKPPFHGKVLSWQRDAKGYDAEALRAKLPVLENPAAKVWEGRPTAPDEAEWRAYVRLMWAHLSLGSRAALMQKGARDRSDYAVYVINRLLAEGHSKEDVFVLVWGAAWNKWRTDRWQPEYLWKLVSYEHVN